MNGETLDFTLGKILTRLEVNDEDHQEIKVLLKDLALSQKICNDKVIALETKAKVWGGVMGSVVGIIIAAVGWFVKH